MNLASMVGVRADMTPDRLALISASRRLTYRELWEQSERVASLMAAHGLRNGDRVLLFADNSPDCFVIYLAAARLGAVFAPVHCSYKERELEYVLRNSRASILFVDGAGREQMYASHGLRRLLPSSVIVLGEEMAWGAAASDQLRLTEAPPLAELSRDDPALIVYTSGSTSPHPTPVVRSHGAEMWNAETYARVWDIRADDRVLLPLPLSWVYGLSTVGLSSLSVGATLVLQSADGTDPMVPAIDEHEISVFAGTMTMYSRLLSELQSAAAHPTSLRRLYIGGESVVLPIVRLVEHYTGIRPLQAYATTEVAPVLAVDPVVDVTAPEGTVGRLVEDCEIRLVDADANDVPVGQVGEAWLRGPGSMLGYWGEPQLTSSRVTRDGWYRSGDYLWRDADGYYFMVGRAEHVIIREGARIALAEVEAAIADLHGVDDAVAIAVPDEDFGEALIAFVVITSGQSLSIDNIYDELGSRIARFKLPREIYVLTEFPLGATGKRDRRQLQSLVESDNAEGAVITMADWLRDHSRDSGLRD